MAETHDNGTGSGLKAFRLSLGMDTYAFSRSLNYSQSHINRLEAGKLYPSFAFLRHLKKVYPWVSIDDVFFADLAEENKPV